MKLCWTTRAPTGWWCSRGLHHEGPCAAREIQATEDALERIADGEYRSVGGTVTATGYGPFPIELLAALAIVGLRERP